MRILHLSDPHLPRRPGVDRDGVDARATLAGLLHDCRHLRGVGLVLVTGDIADDGSAEGCRDVRELVGAYAVERGAAQAYAVGNHDDRSTFAEQFGHGHRDGSGQATGTVLTDDGSCGGLSVVAGLRVITLDSLVPGAVHGLVSQAQLDALQSVLATPAPAGSVVALHHPPIALDRPPFPRANLRNADALAEALRESDVRAVLCGHNHAQIFGLLAGIPVCVTPGTVTRLDLTTPPGLERAVQGAAATVVDLVDGETPTFHTVHSRSAETGRVVYLVDATTGEDRSDESSAS